MGKNKDLVCLYEYKKKTMCHNIGQRRIKLILNSLIKQDDKVAEMYKLALEIENCNINAKKYFNTSSVKYQDNYYEEKHNKIHKLLELCKEYNTKVHNGKITYGWQYSNVRDTEHIVYFELPGMKQISFHITLSKTVLDSIPHYDKEWDGLINSTLDKIEDSINIRYSDKLSKYLKAA